MQIALVNGKRALAFHKGIGLCPICKNEVIAKCGIQKIFHWAHKSFIDCDPWWENETEWHRSWKNRFPENCREISHVDNVTGEIHRADIKTPTGIIVEIQHSNISENEKISREKFYKNMVWIIDGSPFKKNFQICHKLPNPDSKLAKEIIWSKANQDLLGTNDGIFHYARDRYNGMVEIHSIRKIQTEIDNSYNGSHQFYWKNARQIWFRTKTPVYIDFGDEYLVELIKYGSSSLDAIKLLSKKKFLHDVMNKYEVTSIGTKFYLVK